MKKLALLLLLTAIVSCQQELEPSVNNINSVFETQDFGIRFTLESGDEYRMGFLNNDISYFSPQETIRRELSYDDVRLINTFVADRFRESESETETETGTEKNLNSSIEIYNDTRKVVFNTPHFTAEFEQLLSQLKLPYVSTEKK
jgi:hypothetical protein